MKPGVSANWKDDGGLGGCAVLERHPLPRAVGTDHTRRSKKIQGRKDGLNMFIVHEKTLL